MRHAIHAIMVLVSGALLSSQAMRVAKADDFRWEIDQPHEYYTLWDGDLRVLRYNFGNVPMPPGRQPEHFEDGRPYGGERSDYIHPLYGLKGEILTEDYPEHPHHRGIWWSWPVVRWNDRVADIWAVCDVWARPEKLESVKADPAGAELRAANRWEFGPEKHAIVREDMCIRILPKASQGFAGRCVDIDVTLTALEPNVAIGGRPHAGYGGMTLRAIPAKNQQITPNVDADTAKPCRAWCQYSAEFAGGQERTAMIMFQHPGNPNYPTAHLVYPNLNCFMPAFPGEQEYALPKDKPVLLRHRIWIRQGDAPVEELKAMWDAYARGAEAPPAKP